MLQDIIFDWSGTIQDNFPVFVEVCAIMFTRLGGQPPSPELIRQTFDMPYMKFWNHHFPDLTKKEQDKIYLQAIQQVGEGELRPGTKRTLEHLTQAGKRLMVVSSDPQYKILKQIQKGKLENTFQAIYAAVNDKTTKLQQVVKDKNLDPAMTAYVADTYGDMQAAKAAGLVPIGITGGFQNEGTLRAANPAEIVEGMTELEVFVLNYK